MKKEGLQSTVEQIKIDGKFYARKIATEEGKQELVEQAELFRTLPEELKAHYPRLVDVNLDSNPAYYTMDFYPYPTVRKLLIDTDKDSLFINKRLTTVLTFLTEKQHTWRQTHAPNQYIEKKYLERAQKRLQKMVQKDTNFAKILECTRIYIGDEEFQNAFLMVEAIGRDEKVMNVLNPSILCSTHGQMEFGHILVDEENANNFILVDPRGIQDLLDPHYDFGKLRQCSHGLHDWLEEGLFEFKGINVGNKETYVESLNFQLPERLIVLAEVNNLVDSLLPHLTNTGTDSFHFKTLFAEAINLLGSVPFCYGFGNFQKAFACYIQGLRALDEFIRLSGKKI